MTSDLLWQGAELMIVGMGTVFAFLTLLVFATAGMSRLVLRFGNDGASAADSSADQGAEIAAIAAAIALHRARRPSGTRNEDRA